MPLDTAARATTPLEERTWDGRTEASDNKGLPLWQSGLQSEMPSQLAREEFVSTKKLSVLPAFSRDALVQAVVLSQVLGPRGGRRAR